MQDIWHDAKKGAIQHFEELHSSLSESYEERDIWPSYITMSINHTPFLDFLNENNIGEELFKGSYKRNILFQEIIPNNHELAATTHSYVVWRCLCRLSKILKFYKVVTDE